MKNLGLVPLHGLDLHAGNNDCFVQLEDVLTGISDNPIPVVLHAKLISLIKKCSYLIGMVEVHGCKSIGRPLVGRCSRRLTVPHFSTEKRPSAEELLGIRLKSIPTFLFGEAVVVGHRHEPSGTLAPAFFCDVEPVHLFEEIRVSPHIVTEVR